ncbi:MAG: nickel insertion protein, partial [Thermodesulfovibrionales bacterium]
MRIAYFDCFSGTSGDMILGALVDAGADFQAIEAGLKGLGLEGYGLTCRRVMRAGIAATKVDVVVDETAAEARKWKDIKDIIESSSLPEAIKEKALAIFGIIFSAEAAVHAEPVDEVHLHE